MYTKSKFFFLLLLTIVASGMSSQHKHVYIHQEAVAASSLNSHFMCTHGDGLERDENSSPHQHFVHKARFHAMKLIQLLIQKTEPLKDVIVNQVLNDSLIVLDHEQHRRNDNTLHLADSKPKTDHSCQNSIV